MNTNSNNLRQLVLNMLFAMQTLFLASTTWDFFLTVAVKEYCRTAILTMLPSISLIFIVVPWIICILLLSVLLFKIVKSHEYYSVSMYVHYIYAVLLCIYVVLFILAVTNPMTAWPLAMNYLVNAIWASLLVYFRIHIRRQITA